MVFCYSKVMVRKILEKPVPLLFLEENTRQSKTVLLVGKKTPKFKVANNMFKRRKQKGKMSNLQKEKDLILPGSH